MSRKKIVFIFIGLIIAGIFSFFFVGQAPRANKIVWGINFSQKFAQEIGLDWRQTFLAILDDMKARQLKIAGHWDLIEKQDNKFDFTDLDFQMDELAKRHGQAILVFGMKTTRWPECHIPEWAKGLSKAQQQEKILRLVEKVVLRYQDHPALKYWQPENEALFPFGECPWMDDDFYRKEIALVKKLDQKHLVIMAGSGEGSLWVRSALYSDLPSITLYRQVYSSIFKKQVSYPFPPVLYYRKAWLIKQIFKKEVICGELQAEPWCERTIGQTSY